MNDRELLAVMRGVNPAAQEVTPEIRSIASTLEKCIQAKYAENEARYQVLRAYAVKILLFADGQHYTLEVPRAPSIDFDALVDHFRKRLVMTAREKVLAKLTKEDRELLGL